MKNRTILLALTLFVLGQNGLAADASDKTVILEPAEFSKLVVERKYKEAHDTAVSEAKLVPEELDYVRNNKLVPYDKRHIYLRRALEYYEVLLATKETSLAMTLETEMWKTLPEKACLEKMLEVSKRVGNTEAANRLNKLQSQSK